MTKLFFIAKSFLTRKEGATMVEYGLMLALIAVVCVGIIATVGTNAQKTFQTIASNL
jgi:pilus assembly protein Flp/PilA